MLKFDLQKALKGAKVITRNGWDVVITGYQKSNIPSNRVVGSVNGMVIGWHEDGVYQHDKRESIYDLFMFPEEEAMFVNVYSDGIGTWVDEEIYFSKTQAKNKACIGYVKTCKIVDL